MIGALHGAHGLRLADHEAHAVVGGYDRAAATRDPHTGFYFRGDRHAAVSACVTPTRAAASGAGATRSTAAGPTVSGATATAVSWVWAGVRDGHQPVRVIDLASGDRGRADEECDYGKPESAAIRHEVLAL